MINKLISIFKKPTITPSKIIIQFEEKQKNIYRFIKDMLENTSDINSTCQIFPTRTIISEQDINTIKEIEQKYSCHLMPTLNKQTSPQSIKECINKNLFHIKDGYRFTFKDKTLDIMLTSRNEYQLGDPEGQTQYILNNKRLYLGNILTTSDNTPALEVIYDIVSSKLMKDIIGGELELNFNYTIDLNNNRLIKEKLF